MTVKKTLWLYEIGEGTGLVRVTGSQALEKGRLYLEHQGHNWHCIPIETDGLEHASDRSSPPVSLVLTLPQRYGVLDVGKRLQEVVKEGIQFKRVVVLLFDDGTMQTVRNEFYRLGRITLRRNTEIRATIITEQESWTAYALANKPGRCHWTYRGPGCGYDKSIYYDADDNYVTRREQDVCGLRIRSCERRFPNGALPFGGVPESIQPA